MDRKKSNFKRFSRTNLAMSFVKRNCGSWDHQAWLDFCSLIEEKGYTPIDFDQVGALLEAKKAAYLGCEC